MATSRYEQRIQRYISQHPGATRAEARGHKATPEHGLSEAKKNPERFEDYLFKHDSQTREKLVQAALDNFDRSFDPASGMKINRRDIRRRMEGDSKTPKEMRWSSDQLKRAANMKGEEWRRLASRAGKAYKGKGPKSDLKFLPFLYH